MKPRPLITLSILLAVAAAGWLLMRDRQPGSSGDAPRTMETGSTLNALSAAMGRVKSNPGRESFAALKRELLAMPPADASKWIGEMLQSGHDVTSGGNLGIGSDQNFTDWPSLRVLLMDALLACDPAAAAIDARKLLQLPTTADEWAVAMRNLGKASAAAEDTALLKVKSGEMLANAAWRTNPSAGFLEAFDVIVFTRNTVVSPALLDFCGDTANKAVRHAAFLTLDRLVLADPGSLLQSLVTSASANPGIRLMLSNMIARADVRKADHRRIVEEYLLDGSRTGEELQAFAGVFPNANRMVSHNLLTKEPAFGAADRAGIDRAALLTVESWLKDARFSKIHSLLTGTRERLTSFVPQ